MRPVYLEFCGIKSFSEKATIDFTSLLKGGIFGIFGDTGAGKSTILDCIGFALYGKVNRIGKDGSQMSDILNYRSESGYVYFTFLSEWNGERGEYRVERSVNRKGLQKAALYKKEGERFVAIEEGTTRVNDKVEGEILGIGFDDFKKCIALPQGEFSEFLQAGRKDRLELVSKLFSLDSYGYALTKRVSARLAEKQSEADKTDGRLQSYADVNEESLREEREKAGVLQARYEEESKREKAEREGLAEYEKKLRAVIALERAQKEREGLAAREEEMKEKRAAIGKLQTAKRICAVSDELWQAQKNYEKSTSRAELLQEKIEALKAVLEEEKSGMGAVNYDQAIADGERAAALAEAAQKEADLLKEAEKKLKAVIADYKITAEKVRAFSSFDYEREKERLTDELNGLPAENNIVDFIDHTLKDALLQEEYFEFSQSLRLILSRYPETATDVEPLLKKYSACGSGKKINLAEVASDFRQKTAEKERLQRELGALEVKNTKYLALLSEEARLKTEGAERRKEYDERSLAVAKAWEKGTPQQLRQNVELLRKEKQTLQARIDKTAEEIAQVGQSLSGEKASATVYASTVQEKEKLLQTTLQEGGMSEVAEAKALLDRYGDPVKLQRETEEYFDRLLRAKTEIERWRAEAQGGEGYTTEEYERKRSDFSILEKELKDLHAACAVSKSQTEKTEERLREKTTLEKERLAIEHDLSLLEKLRDLVARDKFMEYIAVEYLQEIASNANNLLLRLTGGRYFLTYGEKNFEVGDNFNEGKTRGAHTLSGGEVFLVSLSLALSLSSSIQSNSLRPIEFFFLDEGFGTLDDELVDTVMDCLEKLKNDNFSIGIISHVGELKNRLESKIIVDKANEEHGSTLRVY
jgi:DNA repair exonuclease SbcCD ATPase subunit